MRKKKSKSQVEAAKKFREKIASGEYAFVDNQCFCGNSGGVKIADKDRYGLRYPLLICDKCGIVRADPRLSEQNYADFYSNFYRDIYGEGEESKEILYENKLKQAYDRYGDMASKIDLEEGASVFEIGCDMGTMLMPFKDEGYIVYGCDLGKENIEYGRTKTGIDGLIVGGPGSLVSLGFKADLVIMNHVLEHFSNLEEQLNVIRDIMKDDGCLYVSVPGTYWWLENICRFNLESMLQNAHLYQFTLETLKYVMECCGFEMVYGTEKIDAIFKKTNIKRNKGDVPDGEFTKVRKYFLEHDNKELLIVENEKHVKYLKRKRLIEKYRIIAVSSRAVACLEKSGITYMVPEEFEDRDVVTRLCDEKREMLKGVIKSVDEYLLSKETFLRKYSIEPFKFCTFALSVLSDGYVNRITYLKRILEHYPGKTINVFSNYTHVMGLKFDEMIYSDSASIWNDILGLEGWDAKIKIIKSVSMPYLSWVRKHFRGKRSNKIEHCSSERPYLVICGGKYDWEHSISLLRNEGEEVVAINYEDIYPPYDLRQPEEVKELSELVYDKSGPDIFTVQGISFASLMLKRMGYLFSEIPRASERAISGLENSNIIGKAKGFLTSTSPGFFDNLIKKYFQAGGVPVFQWQHGLILSQKGKVSQLNDYNSMMNTDHLLVYGEEPYMALDEYSGNYSTEIVKVGSASIDHLKSKFDFEEYTPSILYVATFCYNNQWYKGFDPVFPDMKYSQENIRIMKRLKVMADQNKIRITVKLTKHHWGLNKYFPEDSDLFHISYNEESFVELLDTHHMILIDSPTTMVLQAAATRKPVFVYLNNIVYPDRLKSILGKRAVVSMDLEDIFSHISDYIQTKKYTADTGNDEFLKLMGTYSGDGQSAARAYSVVMDRVRG